MRPFPFCRVAFFFKRAFGFWVYCTSHGADCLPCAWWATPTARPPAVSTPTTPPPGWRAPAPSSAACSVATIPGVAEKCIALPALPTGIKREGPETQCFQAFSMADPKAWRRFALRQAEPLSLPGSRWASIIPAGSTRRNPPSPQVGITGFFDISLYCFPAARMSRIVLFSFSVIEKTSSRLVAARGGKKGRFRLSDLNHHGSSRHLCSLLKWKTPAGSLRQGEV